MVSAVVTIMWQFVGLAKYPLSACKNYKPLQILDVTEPEPRSYFGRWDNS